MKPTKHFEVHADDKEVQAVLKHFINVIVDIRGHSWKHFGNCLSTKECKSIPPGTSKQGEKMLVETPMASWERNSKWMVDELNKNMQRLKIVVEDKRGDPYMNDYRHWWGLDRVPAHTWQAEERRVSELGEKAEHDSGEVVSDEESESEDDGDMPSVVQLADDSSSESDFFEED